MARYIKYGHYCRHVFWYSQYPFVHAVHTAELEHAEHPSAQVDEEFWHLAALGVVPVGHVSRHCP